MAAKRSVLPSAKLMIRGTSNRPSKLSEQFITRSQMIGVRAISTRYCPNRERFSELKPGTRFPQPRMVPSVRVATTASYSTALQGDRSSIKKSSLPGSGAPPLPNPSKIQQRLDLPDSSFLYFDEYGREDGVPMFWLHGFPSCGVEGVAIQGLAWKLGIRLICPDRPGMGRSSPWASGLTQNQDLQPSFFPIAEYPKQIAAIAHHLRLGDFALLGASGGGPYAVACAHFLQRELNKLSDDCRKPRLAAAGVVAGLGPLSDMKDWSDAPLSSRMLWTTVSRSPFISSLIQRWARSYVLKDDGAALRRAVEKGVKRLPTEKERKDLSDPAVMDYISRTLNGAFRQERGVFTEGRGNTVRKGWGFALEDIRFTALDGSGLKFWYGDKDANTPLAHGQEMARRIPGATLQVLDGASHYTMGDEFLKEMFGQIFRAMKEDPDRWKEDVKLPDDTLAKALSVVETRDRQCNWGFKWNV